MRRSDLAPDVLAEYKRLQASAISQVQIAIARGLLARVSTQHTTRPEDIAPVAGQRSDSPLLKPKDEKGI